MIESDAFLMSDQAPIKTKVYKRRWVILILYILYAAINAFQWFEYSIIANVVMKFYKVSAVQVDWTSIIYMALYMPMVIPASYLIEKKGLRVAGLIGVSGTALGTIVKIFSLSPNKMWVVYLCQFILSSMQVFILSLPPMIASIWFSPKEVSLACALGVFGTQLGQAVGFVLPPILVKDHEQLEDIKTDFSQLIYGLSGFTVPVTLAVFIYFPARPPLPPCDKKCQVANTSFMGTCRRLLQDRAYNLHAIAYGINIAVFVSISTLLNQFVLSYFPNSEEDAGRIGLLMVVLGMIGSVIFGFILDKTHRYKETTLAIYILSTIAVILFMFALESRSKVFVYISGALIGLFTNAYMPVGLELGIELTYPESESTSSGILISMTQTLGAIFTLMLGYFYQHFGCFKALASMAVSLIIGSVLTACVPNRRKRQDAFTR